MHETRKAFAILISCKLLTRNLGRLLWLEADKGFVKRSDSKCAFQEVLRLRKVAVEYSSNDTH